MILNSLNGGNEKAQKNPPKGLGILTAAALTATLFGSSCTNNKSPEPRQQEAKTKIEITAPEKKTSKEGENTIKFEEAKTAKTPAKNTVEKKLTQDEIDAQEAKERNIPVEDWKKIKHWLKEETQKFLALKPTKESLFDIEEGRSFLASLLKDYEKYNLPISKELKKFEKYLKEREKQQEDQGNFLHLLGDYSGKTE